MARQLKTADILGEITAKDSVPVKTTKKSRPKAKPVVVQKAIAEQETVGKPSPYYAELRAKLRDKVQLNMGSLPRFIVEAFQEQAAVHDMNQREYFIHLLREKGANIPPQSQLDGRKL